jgi:hypothetical protein
MGKHGNEYTRVPRDAYPTPAWVTAALLEHVDVAGKLVWEPCVGAGRTRVADYEPGAPQR